MREKRISSFSASGAMCVSKPTLPVDRASCPTHSDMWIEHVKREIL